MSKFLEIEFKNILSEDEFIKLQTHFNIQSSAFKKQDNIYFDTQDLLLRKRGCALRIRIKNGAYELTLKEPSDKGLLETNQDLTPDDYYYITSFCKLVNGAVLKQIKHLKIPNDFIEIASLSTHRYEFPYKDGMIMLDQSDYYGKTDYELEYEVTDYDKGERIFNDLLNQFNIPKRDVDNKISRAYRYKHHQNR